MATTIANVQDYIRERIKVFDPDMDTRDFTAVSDTWIEPVEVILQPLVDDVEEIRTNQSLKDVELLDDTAVDLLLANLLISRREGSKASGLARAFFSAPVATSFLDGTIFVSKSGVRFISTSTVTISRFTMQTNVEGNLFFVDIPVEAEDPESAGDIAVDALVSIQGGPTGVVRVSNKAAFTGGTDRETNVEAQARAKTAVAVRDLVTTNALTTVLLENFSAIRSLSVVGFGDVEMNRDLLTGTNLSLGGEVFEDAAGQHIGGKVDPYILGTTLAQKTVDIISVKTIIRLRDKDKFDFDPTPTNVMFVAGVDHPIVEIVKIEELDPGTAEPSGVTWELGTDYNYELEETSLSFSTKERPIIRVLLASKEGRDIRITYKSSALIQTVQAFVDSAAQRVVTADILVKHVIPATVDITAPVGVPTGSTLVEATLKSAIEDFIEALPAASTFEVSDFIQLLYAEGATFVNLDALKVTITVFNADGTKTINNVTSSLVPSKNVGYLVGIISVPVTVG